MISRRGHTKASTFRTGADSTNRTLYRESLEDTSDDLRDSSDDLQDSSDDLRDSSDDLRDSSDDLKDSSDDPEDSFDDSEDDVPDRKKLKDSFQRLGCQRKYSYISANECYPSYVYPDLPKTDNNNTIRVLTLEPAKEYHARLRGHLQLVDLRRPPKYQAISYRWSDPTPDYNMMIENSILVTTRSASIALKRIRDRDKSVTVWIDAVCIDQRDEIERGQQVQLVGRIFKQAERALVCLDGNSEHAEDAFKLVEDLYAIRKSSSYNLRDRTDLILRSQLKGRVMGSDCKSLSKIFRHEWFSRLWAVPEVGQAATAEVLCGKSSVAWKKLRFAYFSIRQLNHVGQEFLLGGAHVLPSVRSYRGSDESVEFYSVLTYVRRCNASDPRDRIFALLSHPSALKLGITPDYSKSKRQVFLETATAVLKSTGRLGLLSMVEHGPQDLQEKGKQLHSRSPTWVPQWDRFVGHCIFNRCEDYSSGADSKPVFLLLSDDRELLLSGICFSSIIFHSERLDGRKFWPRSKRAVQSSKTYQNPVMDIWKDMCSQVDGAFTQYSGEQEAWRAYCNTLTAGNCHWLHSGKSNRWVSRENARNPLDALPPLFTYPREWQLLPDAYLADEMPDYDPEDDSKRALLFLQSYAVPVCRDRTFFVTQSGNYGLGPMVMRPGDQVCVIFGMGVPVVLRPCGESWQFVGECYVNGIMHGEIVERWKKGDIGSKTFRII